MADPGEGQRDLPSDKQWPSDNQWIAGTARNPDDIEDPQDQPMTAEQRRRLHDLCAQARSVFDESLSRREAERRIEELSNRRQRGG